MQDEAQKKDVQDILVYVLEQILKLLHPMIPFITEAIWHNIGEDRPPLMLEKYPEYDENLNFETEEADFEEVVAAISAIRNMRATMKIQNNVKTHIIIETPLTEVFEASSFMFSKLATGVEVSSSVDTAGRKMLTLVTDRSRIFIPSDELIDTEKELARLTTEKEKLQKEINMFTNKLANENFVAKAPAAVIEGERQKLEAAQSRMANIEASLAELSAGK